jgi:aldehyde dehydrogenase (NAD+)
MTKGTTMTNFDAPVRPPRLHIGGWLDPDAGESVEAVDPADTRRVVTHVPQATREQALRAAEIAAEGAVAWKAVTPFARGEIIRRASELIAERAEELAVAITLDMGKPMIESRAEVARAVEQARYFAGAAREPQGFTANLAESDAMGFTLRAPVGVVAAIGPWNFPVMIPNWKIAPALAHGNAVVFKPAEIASLTATRLVECYLDAGVPPEVLSLVIGSGAEVGDALVRSPHVDAVTFTGSTAVGLKIAGAAAGLGKRFQVEMGGKNALIVMDDADLDAAVAATLVGGFGTTGQRCTASSRILVHDSVAEEFERRIAQAARGLKVGHGLADDVTAGPLASKAAFDDATTGLGRAIDGGAKVVMGGERLTDGDLQHGWFMAPTLMTAPASGYVFEEEIFGPFVSLHRFASLDEAIALNNSVKYGLSAAIYTSSLTSAHRFVHESDTGMVHVNRPTVGAEPHIPFGGSKASALGPSELGAAAQFYTTTRSAHVRWLA